MLEVGYQPKEEGIPAKQCINPTLIYGSIVGVACVDSFRLEHGFGGPFQFASILLVAEK